MLNHAPKRMLRELLSLSLKCQYQLSRVAPNGEFCYSSDKNTDFDWLVLVNWLINRKIGLASGLVLCPTVVLTTLYGPTADVVGLFYKG
uniref:Uncharacterized protein n=1 Tax=Vibrio sp. FF_286 TaxID=1652831 RepID=A0A0H3ZQS5_9VIBR|nr:hypothetical protein [Vibrio sp. FF_286]